MSLADCVGAVGLPVSAGLARFAFADKSGGVYVNTPVLLLYVKAPSPDPTSAIAADILVKDTASDIPYPETVVGLPVISEKAILALIVFLPVSYTHLTLPTNREV